jgi:hypothetical protein
MTGNDDKAILYKPRSQTEITANTGKMIPALLAHSNVMRDPNFSRIELDDLRRLVTLYDIFFFQRYFTQHYKGKIFFRFSKRMTSTAGDIRHDRDRGTFQIGIAISMLFDNFTESRGEMIVNGLICSNRLEAMMRILEHEATHLIEYIVFGDSNCQAPRFKRIVKDMFGHTETKHCLMTSKKIARLEHNIVPGSPVTFSYQGRTIAGIVQRIGRRATVRGKDGDRYLKFYIPVDMLTPVKPAVANV